MVADSFVGVDTSKAVGQIKAYSEGDQIPTTSFSFVERLSKEGGHIVAKVMCKCGRAEDIPWYYIKQGRRTNCVECRKKGPKLTYQRIGKALMLTNDHFYRWNSRCWGFDTKARPTSGDIYAILLSMRMKHLRFSNDVIRDVVISLRQMNHDPTENELANIDSDMRLYKDRLELGDPMDDDDEHFVSLGSYWDLRKEAYRCLNLIGIESHEIGHPFGDND